MKRIFLLSILCFSLIVSGCSLFKKDSENLGSTDISTKANFSINEIKEKYVFDDENCNKYIDLMECLIDKTPETAKDQTITSLTKVLDLRKGMEKTALPATCKNTMEMLSNQKEVFEKAGCKI